MTLYGFKLVKKIKDKYYSATIFVKEDIHIDLQLQKGYIEYKKDILNIPQDDCGPLCVFDTYENLRIFCMHNFINKDITEYNIWFVAYEPSRQRYLSLKDKRLSFQIFPNGTMLADEIRHVVDVDVDF